MHWSIAAGLVYAQAQGTLDDLLRRGFEEHRQRHYASAIPILESARSLAPRNATVNLLLGIDYLRTGKPRQALPFLEAARRADPADRSAEGYAAEAHAALGEFDRTAEILESIVAGDSGPEAKYALVQFCVRRFGQLAGELRSTAAGLPFAYRLQAFSEQGKGGTKQREALSEVLRLNPGFRGLHSALGWEAIQRGDTDNAAREFEAALAADPSDLEALAGKARLASRGGRSEEAAGLLAEVGSHSPHVLERMLAAWGPAAPAPAPAAYQPAPAAGPDAARLFAQQRWEQLSTRLSRARRRAEEDYWLGVALAQLERYPDAVAPLERAWRAGSHKLESAYWLSISYAREADRQAARLRGEPRGAALAVAVEAEGLLRLARDGAAAGARFEQALALAPEDPALWTGLAEARLLAGATAQARQAAQRAMALDPRRPLAAKVFADAAMQERDYAPAIPVLERVLAGDPGDLAAVVLLGTACSRTGAHARAVDLLGKALAANYPDEKGSLHYLVGASLRALGRESEAAAAFARAAELSGAFASAGHAPEKTP